MRIGIILTRPSPNFLEAAEILSEHGATVDLVFANQGARALEQVSAEHDLYVVKSGRRPAVALAGVLHARGAPTIWPFPIVQAHTNKLVVAEELRLAGVPVPATFLAARHQDLEALLDDGPIVVKPYVGSRGEGVRVVRTSSDLAGLPPPVGDEPIMAQRFLPPDPGASFLVVYRIGGERFALRRRWPSRSPDDQIGELFEPTPRLVELADRCGDRYGADLYSVDFVVCNDSPYVVDMSLHAGFVGVPDAGQRIAAYLRGAWQRMGASETGESQ